MLKTHLALAIPLASAAIAQNHQVVPAAYENVDAPAFAWLAGASRPVRQQILIGSSHLTSLVGRPITGIELRRDASTEAFTGGSANLSVYLSHINTPTVEASSVFANNVGPDVALAFNGTVTLPNSPAPTGGVGWASDSVIDISFSAPFVYLGGTLCVDITGLPVSGQNANWWMADSASEDIAGTATDHGGGCGTYGGAGSNWSSLDLRSLVPGATANFFALGTPNGLAIAAFGSLAPAPIPLSLTGLPAPANCNLLLSQLDTLIPTVFVPPTDAADLTFGGEATVSFLVPNDPSLFGAGLTTQWLDWSQFAASNAITWSIANAAPTLDMALIEGASSDPAGLATAYTAHVLRFEYQ